MSRLCWGCGREFEGWEDYCPECRQMRQREEQHYESMRMQEQMQEQQAQHDEEMEEIERDRQDEEVRHNEEMEEIERSKLQFEKDREEQRKQEVFEKGLIADPVMAAATFKTYAETLGKELATSIMGDLVCKNCEKTFSVTQAGFGEYCSKSCLGDALGEKRKEYIDFLPKYYIIKALASPSIVNALAWLDHLDNCEFSIGNASVGIVEHLRDLFEIYEIKVENAEVEVPFEYQSPPENDLANHEKVRQFLTFEQSIIDRIDKKQKPHPHTYGSVYSEVVKKPWLKELLGKELDYYALYLQSVSAARKVYLRNVLLPNATINKNRRSPTFFMAICIFWAVFANDSVKFNKFRGDTSLLTWGLLLTAFLAVHSEINEMIKGESEGVGKDFVNSIVDALDKGNALQNAVDVMVWLYEHAKTSADYEMLEKLFRQLDKAFSIENAADYAEACETQAIAMKRKEIEKKKAAEKAAKKAQEELERQLAERKKWEEEEERREYYQYAIQLLEDKNHPQREEALKQAETIFNSLGSYESSTKYLQECKTELLKIEKMNTRAGCVVLIILSIIVMLILSSC